jgi:hypothetical protein
MKRMKKAAPQVTAAAADIVQASTAAPEPESAPILTPFQALINNRVRTRGSLSYTDVRDAYKEFHSPKRVRFFASHMSKLADALAAHGVSVQGSDKDASLVLDSVAPTTPTTPAKAEAPAPPPPPEKTHPASASQSTAQSAPTAATTPTLYIGCAPMGSRPTPADIHFAGLYAEVEKELELSYWLAHKYNEGVKVAVAKLASAVASTSPENVLGGDLHMPKSHPLADGLVSILLRHGYTNIVMG